MQQQDKVYRTELTPLSFLRRSAYVFPEKTAVVHGDRRYTYREFEERVHRLANRLLDAGLRKGDRVAFLAPNIPALLEARAARLGLSRRKQEERVSRKQKEEKYCSRN